MGGMNTGSEADNGEDKPRTTPSLETPCQPLTPSGRMATSPTMGQKTIFAASMRSSSWARVAPTVTENGRWPKKRNPNSRTLVLSR